MKEYIQDQRGIAMVLELVLVAGVLVIIGAAVYVGYQTKHTSTTPQTAVVSTPSTVPNGNVDNVTNALTQDAASDGSSSTQEGAFVPANDTSTNAAQDVSGSYDENSF